jgi:hypothetical protein
MFIVQRNLSYEKPITRWLRRIPPWIWNFDFFHFIQPIPG